MGVLRESSVHKIISGFDRRGTSAIFGGIFQSVKQVFLTSHRLAILFPIDDITMSVLSVIVKCMSSLSIADDLPLSDAVQDEGFCCRRLSQLNREIHGERHPEEIRARLSKDNAADLANFQEKVRLEIKEICCQSGKM